MSRNLDSFALSYPNGAENLGRRWECETCFNMLKIIGQIEEISLKMEHLGQTRLISGHTYVCVCMGGVICIQRVMQVHQTARILILLLAIYCIYTQTPPIYSIAIPLVRIRCRTSWASQFTISRHDSVSSNPNESHCFYLSISL